MKARFIYRDFKGNTLIPGIFGKLKENEEDVIKQCNDEIYLGSYILVTIGEDGETFENSYMTGIDDFKFDNYTSIYPILN